MNNMGKLKTDMKKILWIGLGLMIGSMTMHAYDVPVIPLPQQVHQGGDSVEIPLVITYTLQMPDADRADLEAYLPSYALDLRKSDTDGWLKLRITEPNPDSEAYTLVADKDGATIESPSAAGLFYGLQTLAQLVRGKERMPMLAITDAPRFPYRGVHIDESRHFFGKDYVKKQLDLLSTYKINRLHWHLTDAAGWRLEIPAYPRLTELAAWRPQRYYDDWHHESRYCEHDTPGAYGGYYTAADVKEILEYARLRHITIIPEIEMPGHSAEVCAAYPELSCYGEPYTSGEVCIGNEATFAFFEGVLDEVMRLFPSHYIHIGGDEASRKHWKQCAKCQQRMADEGLKDEAELQSYMISRIEKYVNSHGRDIIGWDEILEGGLAPNATVMSWRSEKGGINAAKMGHDAIMTPSAYCYLDAYQDVPDTQPKAFGGPVTLENCYSFNPAPDSLSATVRSHIIGVQGNNWAEYIPTPEHGEYMLYPRIIALAEVGWTNQELRDQESFKHRINHEVRHIRSIGYNAFPLSELVKPVQNIDYDKAQICLELTSERTPADIRYTLDGSEPDAGSPSYQAPFAVSDSILLKARLFDNGHPIGTTLSLRTDYHKAIGKKIHYFGKGYYRHRLEYQGGGDSGLIDGLRGGDSYKDGRWQGFCPGDLEAVVDLGEVTDVHRVMANFMQMRAPSVFLPEKVEVWASTDGEEYNLLGEDVIEEDIRDEVIFRDFGWTGAPVQARYIKFNARQRSERQNAGFLFTDEIVVQ